MGCCTLKYGDRNWEIKGRLTPDKVKKIIHGLGKRTKGSGQINRLLRAVILVEKNEWQIKVSTYQLQYSGGAQESMMNL